MNILVIQEVYPSVDNPYQQAWAHVRNKAYVAQGASVKVVCSSAKSHSSYEGVDVYPLTSFRNLLDWCSLIVVHQPNIKLHYRLLRNNKDKKIVFFLHGHEVMFINEDYSRPFLFSPDAALRNKIFRYFYDRVKVFLLKRLFLSQGIDRVGFVFVSNWMKDIFQRRVKFDVDLLRYKYSVMPNSIASVFLDKSYKLADDVYADFISIRQWDWSKHGVDLVLEAAAGNRDKTFHIYGNGSFCEYIDVPPNVVMKKGFISPSEIPELLNHYRCALMPTRVDSQGVMACEMASFGIPLISSNISVAREFLSEFPNVNLIQNSNWYSELNIPDAGSKDIGMKFSAEKLCSEELAFFNYFLNVPMVK